MREIRMFELDGNQAVFWESPTPQSLQVLQGLLWLTVEGEPGDHWLRAGETFEIRPGQRLWLGTWKDGSRFRLSQPMAGLTPQSHRRAPRVPAWRLAWRAVAGRLGTIRSAPVRPLRGN